MNRKMKITGIVALLFFATGCSGYRTVGAYYDGIGRGPDLGDLGPGDEVRLNLLSGIKFQGTITEIGKESLTIELANPKAWVDAGMSGEKVGEFAFLDLGTIELREGGDSQIGPILSHNRGVSQ